MKIWTGVLMATTSRASQPNLVKVLEAVGTRTTGGKPAATTCPPETTLSATTSSAETPTGCKDGGLVIATSRIGAPTLTWPVANF